MSDAEMLQRTMYEVALELATLVGLPPGLDDESLHEFDAAKRGVGVLRRDAVPEIAWRGAVMALDFLTIAIGMSDPDAPAAENVDGEMVALLDPRKQARP